MAFRVNDGGYYAFLLSTSPQAYKSGELSFKVVKKTYRNSPEVQIVPWTQLSAKLAHERITGGIKLSVECVGHQITLFVDDLQVARLSDATYESGYVGLILLGEGHMLFRNLDVEGTR